MKIFVQLFFIIFFLKGNAQTYKVMFDYDAAGNQYHKYIVFESGRFNMSDVDKHIKEVTEEEKILLEESVKYYPNPVKESLFVYWTNTSESLVNEIFLLDMNGKILYESKVLNKTQISISLGNYTNGIYLISINYSDGKSKSYKIIKN